MPKSKQTSQMPLARTPLKNREPNRNTHRDEGFNLRPLAPRYPPEPTRICQRTWYRGGYNIARQAGPSPCRKMATEKAVRGGLIAVEVRHRPVIKRQ